MPIACDPNQTFEVVLPCDQGKAAPPTFIFRYRSYRRYAAVEAFLADKANLNVASAAKVYEHLRADIAGWRNVADELGEAVPFDGQRLEDVTAAGDAFDLLSASQAQCRLGSDDRKNSDSPPGGSPAASAAAAETTG